MNYLVCYDIPADDPKMRKKIADICMDYGLLRLQLSVFWGTISHAEIRELALQCEEIIDNAPIDLRFIAVCDSCLQKSFAILHNYQLDTEGLVELASESKYSIVSHIVAGWDEERIGGKKNIGKGNKKEKKIVTAQLGGKTVTLDFTSDSEEGLSPTDTQENIKENDKNKKIKNISPMALNNLLEPSKGPSDSDYQRFGDISKNEQKIQDEAKFKSKIEAKSENEKKIENENELKSENEKKIENENELKSKNEKKIENENELKSELKDKTKNDFGKIREESEHGLTVTFNQWNSRTLDNIIWKPESSNKQTNNTKTKNSAQIKSSVHLPDLDSPKDKFKDIEQSFEKDSEIIQEKVIEKKNSKQKLHRGAVDVDVLLI